MRENQEDAPPQIAGAADLRNTVSTCRTVPGSYGRSAARMWALAWRGLLRSLFAVFLSQLAMLSAITLWARIPYRLVFHLHSSQVTRDTMVLAIPLATRSVALGCLILSACPCMLAVWGARYSVQRRALAALAGIGTGLLFATVWQIAASLSSGYSFILRHSIPDPTTFFDILGLGLACVAGFWSTLAVIPVRKVGGLSAWALFTP